MKLYIPELGDQLRLTSDWIFDLHHERRNASLWKELTGEDYKWIDKVKSTKCIMPKGTVLAVDRIYIRKGASDFSSISFRIVSHPKYKKEKKVFGETYLHRFWAKLQDCNNIEYDLDKTVIGVHKITVWDYEICDVKKYGGHRMQGKNVARPEKVHKEGNGYIKDIPAVLVNINYSIGWESVDEKSLFGLSTTTYWYGTPKNIKYTLYDLKGNKLGEWGTLATLKKTANEYVKKHF